MQEEQVVLIFRIVIGTQHSDALQQVRAQVAAVEIEVAKLTDQIQADKTLQTYIQRYTKVKQVRTGLLLQSRCSVKARIE